MAKERSSSTTDDARPERGGENHLVHVRALFRVRFPSGLHRLPSSLFEGIDVDPDTIRRVFKKRTWTKFPDEEYIEEIATFLKCPTRLVLFSFMADLHPHACDENMYALLRRLATMTPDELTQMRHSADSITSTR